MRYLATRIRCAARDRSGCDSLGVASRNCLLELRVAVGRGVRGVRVAGVSLELGVAPRGSGVVVRAVEVVYR